MVTGMPLLHDMAFRIRAVHSVRVRVPGPDYWRGFLQRDLPDDNGAGPGAGPNVSKAYQAPGEDFVSGTQRQLNDGTYGVVISAEPTTVALSRPLLTVLQHERIAAGTPARKVLILERPATGPSLQVMVDR